LADVFVAHKPPISKGANLANVLFRYISVDAFCSSKLYEIA